MDALALNQFALWTLLLLNLLLTLSLARRVRHEFPPDLFLKPGEKAPDFSAPSLSGEIFERSRFEGKKYTLIFTSPDCITCDGIIDGLRDLRAVSREQDIELILVSDRGHDATLPHVSDIGKNGVPVLIAPRTENPLFKDYRVPGVPSYVYVGETGAVIQAATVVHPGEIRAAIIKSDT